jgi:hypothetical protein
MIKTTIVSTLFVFLFSSLIYSQRMIERMVSFNPLFNERNNAGGEISWINTISGWGEFGGYLHNGDGNHGWYQKLGGFAEFFRISDKQSLSLLSNIEFIADPHNDINFNPRAIYWEEAILYSFRTGKDFWQIGYYHRCKHDIDNLDLGFERSLIYGSIHGRYHHPFQIKGRTEVLASVRGDLYTILQDHKKPKPEELLSSVASNLSFSTSFNLNVRHKLSGIAGLFFSSFLQLDFYSTREGIFRKLVSINDTGINGGAETGLFLEGRGRMKFALRFEYFTDTGINLLPQHAYLGSLGLSFYPFEMF